MLSNSCRYGIRAVIYLAGRVERKSILGIKQISEDLELPTPFLAKIMQQLAKHKILNSVKGPHGGFSLLKDPAEITLFDLVRIIDGEEVLTNCLIHKGSCRSVDIEKKPCPVHDEYSDVRNLLIEFFQKNTIADIVKRSKNKTDVVI
ncbi:MAG: Rrf2 family transcriptional regulator [Bacteroidales bacterium]|jgi:Rrf2 family protein|nr:Rrf2 family transcriptional regulator [Bacteroidales bacterium]